MSDQIHLATRKGLFTLHRSSSGWKADPIQFEGQNCNMLRFDRRDDTLYIAFDHGHFGVKLQRSRDGGKTWDECSVPEYPELTDADRAKQEEAGEVGARRDFSSLKEIWELTPGGTDQPGRLWAGTIPGGLFVSDDCGASWSLVESLWNLDARWEWFGGGKDHPGIHSVSVHPENSDHVIAGISCGGVWFTENGGQSWEARCEGMRAEYMPPERAFDPNIQDPHRLVQCQAAPDHLWVQHHNGIFRSTDSGRNWQELNHAKPSGFGFAVVVHPRDPNTAWFVPAVKDECRVPVDGRFVVTRTRDGGVTFESLTNGLPQATAFDIVLRHSMDIDESGDRLVMGSTTGNVWVSEDAGDSWTCVSTFLPPVYCARFA